MNLIEEATVTLSISNAIELEPALKPLLDLLESHADAGGGERSRVAVLVPEQVPVLLGEYADAPALLVHLPAEAAPVVPVVLDGSVEIVNEASADLLACETLWLIGRGQCELRLSVSRLHKVFWEVTRHKQLVLFVRAGDTLWAKRLTERSFGDAEDLGLLLQATCFASTNHDPRAMYSRAELRAAAGETATPGSAAHPVWTPRVGRLD